MTDEAYKPFCKVLETYQEQGDYLVLVLDRLDQGEYFRDEIVQIRRQNNEPITCQSTAVRFVRGLDAKDIPFHLAIKGLKAGDVPVGSEVWLNKTRPERVKSRKFEYVEPNLNASNFAPAEKDIASSKVPQKGFD